tara:strand:- start:95 stop:562 length:468 start_codon:yes stop_codon:yes gene_type:complete
MADLKDVVTEMETIAGLGTNNIQSFKYGNEFEINEFRQSTKPLLLFHKQRAYSYATFERKHRDYTITIGIYDQYNQTERGTTDYITKQLSLEDEMEKFIRSFRTRYIADASTKTWYMLSGAEDRITGELIEVIGADKLIGITATFVVRVFTDCDT